MKQQYNYLIITFVISTILNIAPNGIRIGGRFNAAYAVLADEVNCLKNLKRKYHARKNV